MAESSGSGSLTASLEREMEVVRVALRKLPLEDRDASRDFEALGAIVGTIKAHTGFVLDCSVPRRRD